MKNWEKYRDYLETGDFHVHTDYTDGSDKIADMCAQAVMNNLNLICFAEHVSKAITYDYSAFLADIESARRQHDNLIILPGCEAKVLDESGNINVSKEIVEKAEIVVAAFHGFPYGRKEDFLSAIHGMLRHPRVDIWGHPQTFLRNVDLTRKEMCDIINACRDNKVLVENSLAQAYRTDPSFIEMAKRLGAVVVTNSDAHSREELKTLTTFK